MLFYAYFKVGLYIKLHTDFSLYTPSFHFSVNIVSTLFTKTKQNAIEKPCCELGIHNNRDSLAGFHFFFFTNETLEDGKEVRPSFGN